VHEKIDQLDQKI